MEDGMASVALPAMSPSNALPLRIKHLGQFALGFFQVFGWRRLGLQ